MRYSDDLDNSTYKKSDKSLFFNIVCIRTTLSYDESAPFNEFNVRFTLKENNLNSFSTLDSLPVSIIFTGLIWIVFIGFLYYFPLTGPYLFPKTNLTKRFVESRKPRKFK